MDANYIILINKDGSPVLVEVPEKPIRERFGTQSYYEKYMKDYEQSFQQALSDTSKHIRFKDDAETRRIWGSRIRKITDNLKLLIGQTFPLPEGVRVSFGYQYYYEEESKWIDIKAGFDVFDLTKEIRKLAILTPTPTDKETVSKDERIPSYEYCSVICDVIDDLLIQGGARELDRSVGLFHKLKDKLESAGFKIVRINK